MDVTVIVGTFGGDEWIRLAERRALPSVPRDAPTIHIHGETLHEARNEGVEQASTEWVCVLDADDELTHGYFQAMERATADVRAPAVQYVRDALRPRRGRLPRVAGHIHDCSADCLPHGNWLVIGSLVRRDMFLRVGGFRDFRWSEDWDLWLRCYLAGATFEAVPQAVYRAYVRTDSRNRGISADERVKVHHEIAAANGVTV